MVQQSVFLSHASYDKPFAVWLYENLKYAGYDVWFDSTSIPKSKDWSAEIFDGVKQCEGFILLLSSHSINSKWVSKEYTVALSEKKVIFPIKLPGLEMSALDREEFHNLDSVQFVNLHEYGVKTQERFLEDLLDALDIAGFERARSSLLNAFRSTNLTTSDEPEFVGKPEHYSTLILADDLVDAVRGIRALSATGMHDAEEWIKKLNGQTTGKHRLPTFIPVLIGKLFDEDSQIVSEAVKAIDALGVVPYVPNLIDTILAVTSSAPCCEDELQTLILNNYSDIDLTQVIEKVKQYGLQDLAERLERDPKQDEE